MKKIKAIIATFRPNFLILTPSCVALGAATAYASSGTISIIHLILIITGAVAAHAGVNALNEYSDFKSGLDLKTERTPFSGGTGTLPQHPEYARSVFAAGIAVVLLSAGIGLYFIISSGWKLMLIWGLGVFLAAVYSPWLTRMPLITLIAPGAGFGFAMVCSAHYILAGSLSLSAVIASLVPFFLVNNLLLLNQFPDVEADRTVGRRNFPLVKGRRASAKIFALFSVSAVFSLIAAVAFSLLPVLSLIALIPLAMSLISANGALKFSDTIEKLLPYMVMNVIANITAPALMAVGIFLG